LFKNNELMFTKVLRPEKYGETAAYAEIASQLAERLIW
jgi:hypothetical protein